MAWSNISACATSMSDTLPLFAPTWRDRILSQWYWLLLLISIMSVTALLHRRYRQDVPVDIPWDDLIPSAKNSENSPFSAYLGHNVLTDGCPNDPTNTSIDAIGRIAGHDRLETPVLAEGSEEPQEYSSGFRDASLPLHQYRSYTYPDTQNKQMRYDRVQQMSDTAQNRRWQRRTMYICAI